MTKAVVAQHVGGHFRGGETALGNDLAVPMERGRNAYLRIDGQYHGRDEYEPRGGRTNM